MNFYENFLRKQTNKQTKICPHMFKRLGWWRLWSGFWGGRFKVSQLLGVTTTIASLDTYEGSTKRVQIVSLRRWLNGDGWGVEAKVLTVSKVSRILGIITHYNSYSSWRFMVYTAHMNFLWNFMNYQEYEYGPSWIRHEYEFGCHEFMWIWISKTWIWIWISASWIWHEYKYPVHEYEYQVHEYKYQIYAYIWIWAVWTNLPFDDLHFSPPVFVFSPILPWFSIFLFVKISQKNWVYFEKMTLTVSFLGIVWCRYTVFIFFFGIFFTFSNGSIDICIDFHIKKWPWKNCNFEIDILKSWK